MKKIYHLLHPHIRPHLWMLFGAFLLSFALAGIKASHAYLIKPIIDSGIQAGSTLGDVVFLVGVLMGLALLNFPVRFFHFYWTRFVVENSICRVRTQTYSKLQKLPFKYFQENSQGVLLSSLLNDTHVLSLGLLAMVNMVREILTASALFGLALYQDWQLTLVVAAAVPILVVVFQQSGKKVRTSQSNAQGHIAELTHDMGEGLQGQKLVKAFNLRGYVVERFQKSQGSFFRFVMKAVRIEEIVSPIVEFVATLIFCIVFLFAFYRISSGALTPGAFISFIGALALLLDPIRRHTRANAEFNRARAAGERIQDILNLPEEKDTGDIEKKGFERDIELKGVTFSYGESEALKDFSLHIRRGEKVALVGLSGSGKSTLINLFLRLYDIQKGEVLIDGTSIRKLTLTSLRSLFGLVSQDIFLFNDTVKENVVLDGAHSEEKFAEALRVSYADEFVNKLSNGGDTPIGDRGARLSGGQAQRLTIARAYLRQNPILLFDEATSALDNESEKIVQKALDEFSSEYTVIAVAHRLSTIQHFDKIVVLREGRKIEQGNHEELMELGGEYRRLYELST